MEINDTLLMIYIISLNLWMIYTEIRLRTLSHQWKQFNDIDYDALTERLTRR